MRKRYRWEAAFVLLAVWASSGCTSSHRLHPPQGNTLRLAVDAKFTTLDPHQTVDAYGAQAESLVYEPLYQHGLGRKAFQPEPLIAASAPGFSADRKTATIRLKKGVYFHEDPCLKKAPGSPSREVTAEDIVYLFHRVGAPGFSSPMYGLFEESLSGMRAYHEGKTPTIAGVRALDGSTVELKLLKPLPRLATELATVKLAVVPKECVDYYGERFGSHPVGTGPFYFESVEPGSKLVARRNANYRVPGVPSVDKVIWEVLVESQPQWLKFMSGDLDILSVRRDNFSSVLTAKGELSPELARRGIQLGTGPRADVTVLAFNMKDPVWGKHKDLRHAVALALDIPKIIELQYGGQAVRAHSLLNPTMYGYDSGFQSAWSKRDVVQAKALLARAGYPEGRGLSPLVLPRTDSTMARQLEEMESSQLKEVGIVLKSEVMTWPELMRRMDRHDFTAVGMGLASELPDVEDMLGNVDSRFIESGQNAAAYSNAKVDRLASEISSLDNGPERLKKIRELIEILDDDLPYVPMTHRLGIQLAQPWVRNYFYADTMALGSALKVFGLQTSGQER